MTKEQPFLESGRIRNEVNIQKSDKVNNLYSLKSHRLVTYPNLHVQLYGMVGL